jgi:hypothetical protein
VVAEAVAVAVATFCWLTGPMSLPVGADVGSSATESAVVCAGMDPGAPVDQSQLQVQVQLQSQRCCQPPFQI